MKWQRGIMLAVWAIGSAALCSTSMAQTSKEYARMGTKAYRAFRCSKKKPREAGTARSYFCVLG
jgi:hypothetical protein